MTHLHPLQIGSVTTPNNVWLGPMAGVSDLPFRLLCKEMGAGCVSMEMVSAKAITYHNEKTMGLVASIEEERPVTLQLFGSDPSIMAEAVHLLHEAGVVYDILDINMGCPMPKIVNNGEGSALMKNPRLIEEIVRACVPLSPPVTVKLRSGWDAAHINAVECALAAEAGGAASVTIHARTKEQLYTGRADWNLIAQVKEAVQIPVIGSGDVTDGESAKRLLTETECDGVMIARAARGNPFLFHAVTAFLKDGTEIPPPDDAVMKETILRHARLLTETEGESIAVRKMRKHLAWYTAGRKGSARLRRQMTSVTTLENVERLCELIFDKPAET